MRGHPTSMTDFIEAELATLDSSQRDAASSLRGPVCILAGAGSGKTRTITTRIALGISTGAYAPDRVLALTYTNRAASEMKTRLRRLGAGGVDASTFHSAALRQLQHFWPLHVGGDAPRILNGKAQLLAECARNLSIRADTGTLRDIASDIEWRKVSDMTIEQFEAGASERHTVAHLSPPQVVALHREYERLKDDRRVIDFEDVLLLTTGLLASEESALLHVRERFRFFVVDEYQDVSPIQQNLLELWLGDRREICVVGDPSQTIYSFTGATSRFLIDFPRQFPDAKVYRLDTNYRSPTTIVHVANSVMRGVSSALELSAIRGGGAEVAVERYSDDLSEARGVAGHIARDISAGINARDIAVLFRSNAQGALVEQALSESGVSFHTVSGPRFFDLPEVKQAILALRGASVSETTDPLFKSVSDVLRSLGWTQDPPDVTGSARNRWEALNALVVLADNAPSGTTLRDFSTELLERQAARHEPTLEAVTLSSIHAAKGLEWESVYLIGASEGLIPISLASTESAINEERRVMYVGVTRAREMLTISWAAESGFHGTPRVRSRFLSGLGSDTARENEPRRR